MSALYPSLVFTSEYLLQRLPLFQTADADQVAPASAPTAPARYRVFIKYCVFSLIFLWFFWTLPVLYVCTACRVFHKSWDFPWEVSVFRKPSLARTGLPLLVASEELHIVPTVLIWQLCLCFAMQRSSRCVGWVTGEERERKWKSLWEQWKYRQIILLTI